VAIAARLKPCPATGPALAKYYTCSKSSQLAMIFLVGQAVSSRPLPLPNPRSPAPATLFSLHVQKLRNNWGVRRDESAAGARYRGVVRSWVRPHRTPIHSSDVLGNLARVEPVSFAVETATASATAKGGRTGALRGLPSEESSGPSVLGDRAALPFLGNRADRGSPDEKFRVSVELVWQAFQRTSPFGCGYAAWWDRRPRLAFAIQLQASRETAFKIF
jgi:hypothetical protein